MPGDLGKALNKRPDTCHALLLPESETENAAEWLKVTAQQPVLPISEDPNFIQKGGEVALAPNQQKPGRFIYLVHVERLKERRIRFNSGFLRIRSSVTIINP